MPRGRKAKSNVECNDNANKMDEIETSLKRLHGIQPSTETTPANIYTCKKTRQQSDKNTPYGATAYRATPQERAELVKSQPRIILYQKETNTTPARPKRQTKRKRVWSPSQFSENPVNDDSTDFEGDELTEKSPGKRGRPRKRAFKSRSSTTPEMFDHVDEEIDDSVDEDQPKVVSKRGRKRGWSIKMKSNQSSIVNEDSVELNDDVKEVVRRSENSQIKLKSTSDMSDVHAITICRLCGEKGASRLIMTRKANEALVQLAYRYLHVDFTDNSGLPLRMCMDCTDKLRSFNEFASNVKTTTRKMSETLHASHYHPPWEAENDSAKVEVREYNWQMLRNEITEIHKELEDNLALLATETRENSRASLLRTALNAPNQPLLFMPRVTPRNLARQLDTTVTKTIDKWCKNSKINLRTPLVYLVGHSTIRKEIDVIDTYSTDGDGDRDSIDDPSEAKRKLSELVQETRKKLNSNRTPSNDTPTVINKNVNVIELFNKKMNSWSIPGQKYSFIIKQYQENSKIKLIFPLTITPQLAKTVKFNEIGIILKSKLMEVLERNKTCQLPSDLDANIRWLRNLNVDNIESVMNISPDTIFNEFEEYEAMKDKFDTMIKHPDANESMNDVNHTSDDEVVPLDSDGENVQCDDETDDVEFENVEYLEEEYLEEFDDEYIVNTTNANEQLHSDPMLSDQTPSNNNFVETSKLGFVIIENKQL